MWIFSRYGFFSAVCARDPKTSKPDPKRLQVRARVKAHLLALLDKFGSALGYPAIKTTDDTDYHYRIIVSKRAWTDTVEKLTEDIDYINFKGACPEPRYHEALLQIWRVMHRMQEQENSQKKDLFQNW